MSDPTPPPKTSTARHALGGMVWSGLGFGSQAVGQFLVVIVFARYLSKSDNGLVGAALIVIAFGQLFTEAGFGPAVIQRQNLTDEHVRTAFALSMLTGVAMTVLVFLGAPLVASFFHQPGFAEVTQGLAFVFLLQAPGVVAMAMLQRDLDFKSIAIAETVSYFFGFALVGVVLAISGVGVWSIVVAQLAQAALLTGILVFRRSHPRSLRPRRAESRDLIVYAGGMTAARGFNFAALNGDNSVVGNQMGSVALGVYKNAYALAAFPAQMLGQVMDRVIFPVISRFQEDLERVASAYLRGVSLVATLTLPASVLAVLLAPEIIHLLLGGGPKWDDVILPFQIMAGGLLFRTSYKISDSLARAMGTVYRRAWRQAAYAVGVIVGALVGSLFGLGWVAVGVTGAIVLNYLLMAQLSLVTAHITWAHFIGRQLRGLGLAALVAAVSVPTVLWLRSLDLGGQTANLVVSAGGALSAVLVLGVAWLIRPDAVLGDDGRWIVNVIRSRKSSAEMPMELRA
ncbi:MAG: lipopolysaccharide biosynthesis protein [Acidimicrobiia bacterium]|nr:lipopolysaccharide biosynthesis protein [Acidimicrobiia bacterium]